MSTPACCLKSSPVRWISAPVPEEAKVILPGLAFASATSSFADRACDDAGTISAIVPWPMRATGAESAVAGKKLDAATVEAAGRAAAAQCEPTADLRGSVEYKRDLVRVLTKRALRQAAARA